MKKYKGVPSFDELIEPCMVALKKLGGSGTVNEIYEQVISDLNLSDDVLSVMQTKNGSQTKVAYNLAWARTYLKKYGAINNPSHSIWEITNEFKNKEIKKQTVVEYKSVWGHAQNDNTLVNQQASNFPDADAPEEIKPWNDELMNSLLEMNPFAFERLSQLLLRKMGIDDVFVTKKTNDGGIDGYGLFKLNGVISFRLAFQCKRYKGTVGSSDIRDFRGSNTSDVEKLLFITTGTFSQEAKKEASMPGKPKVDLMDGDDLVSKLIEYNMGVSQTIAYVVDKAYFKNF